MWKFNGLPSLGYPKWLWWFVCLVYGHKWVVGYGPADDGIEVMVIKRERLYAELDA